MVTGVTYLSHNKVPHNLPAEVLEHSWTQLSDLSNALDSGG